MARAVAADVVGRMAVRSTEARRSWRAVRLVWMRSSAVASAGLASLTADAAIRTGSTAGSNPDPDPDATGPGAVPIGYATWTAWSIPPTPPAIDGAVDGPPALKECAPGDPTTAGYPTNPCCLPTGPCLTVVVPDLDSGSTLALPGPARLRAPSSSPDEPVSEL